MSNHSNSKINMAAFNKKKMISENLRGNYFFHICNLFYERTKFFLFGGSFQYRFQSRKQGILQKNFLDRSINRSIVAFQRTQAINFSASWPVLLEAWLVLTSVKYHGNLYILIPLNQRLALTRLRATGPWRIFMRQGRRGDKITGAYEFTDIGY